MRTFNKVLLFLIVNILIVLTMAKMTPNMTKLKEGFNDTANGTYETLLIGQSHSEACINPFILSDKTGLQTYNLGSSAIPTENVYYILKEGNKNNKCRRVIYDLDSNFFKNPLEPGGTYIYPDLTGENKFDYLKDNCGKIPFFSLGVNYSNNPIYIIGTLANIKRYLNHEEIVKKSARYDYSDSYKYKGRGFLYGYNLKSNWAWNNPDFDSNKVNENNLETFRKIVEYCNENDIELICVQSAVTPYRIKKQNTAEIHNYFTKLCKSYNIPFYDMNYVKKEYMDPVQKDFIDQEGHMFGEMADKQTKVIAEIIQTKDKEKYFYTNFNDVYKRVEAKD